ncbi:unnamed protein product [Ixodes pacificus]
MKVNSGLSLDVADLFYSVPHKGMFEAVGACIEVNGNVAFQNQCELPLESFLELPKFYLTSTVVMFNNHSYIQKQGICIGSCVTPVQCNIFLSQCERDISQKLPNNLMARVFRYVDDYLVLLHERPAQLQSVTINTVQSNFCKQAKGLKFTYELPTDSKIQFLDLQLLFGKNYTCWTYSPRSKNRLLQFDSAH